MQFFSRWIAGLLVLANASLFNPSNLLAESTVKICSKGFTESVLLGECLAHLARSAGAKCEHKAELGGTQVLWKALQAGDVDAYVDYTGTIREELLADAIRDGKTIRSEEDMRRAMLEKGILMSEQLGFNNTYALGMREADAAKRGISKISDLRNHPDLEFGISDEFMERLSSIMDASNFILIACVVDKARVSKSGNADTNPYHIALGICLEALREFLAEKGQDQVKTHVLVECRGKKEDAELELEFRRICDGDNPGNRILPFDIVFADKKTNLTGLQLADLVARPVGLNYIRPTQANQAIELLKKKFFCDGGRARVGSGYENVGLMVYPFQKAKSPDEPTEAVAPTRNPQSI